MLPVLCGPHTLIAEDVAIFFILTCLALVFGFTQTSRQVNADLIPSDTCAKPILRRNCRGFTVDISCLSTCGESVVIITTFITCWRLTNDNSRHFHKWPLSIVHPRSDEEKHLWRTYAFVTSMALPVTVVGQYTVLEEIGNGAFATVFKARHSITGEYAAIKSIKREKLNRKLQENLEAEIAILKVLDHPNIVKLYAIEVCHWNF